MNNPPADRPKGNILVVDDNVSNLRLLSSMLAEHGYKVRSVVNGPMALTAVQAAPPDLILLDINMPEMNGYQVCEQLKAGERTRDIPILFISALDELKDKVKAFNIGGVDYITKPFQFEEVLARVQTHLALRDLQRRFQAANAELERSLEALAYANVELLERNEELDAFAHTVAHDLKNPLTGLIGYSGLLESRYTTLPTEQVSNFLRAIARTSRKLDTIIDELLLLAGVRKMDKIEPQRLDMAGIVAEAQGRLTDLIEEYKAEIVVPEAKAWPAALGRGPWVEEVWANYLSNAIKYGGQPPHVEMGAEARAGMIRFWVRDNGEGIALEEQERLFAPFEELHKVRAKGHGLGLSIVRRIVEKLGGRVGVESEPGQGSLFFFTLPAASEDIPS
jgi:two-component system sensor histidine kinase/response regulator